MLTFVVCSLSNLEGEIEFDKKTDFSTGDIKCSSFGLEICDRELF